MREMHEQVLDAMDLERERGITIKAHAVRMKYTAQNGEEYQPQSHRYSRPRGFFLRSFTLAGFLRGALLVVDASQGVEAQTLANAYLAINNHLEIIRSWPLTSSAVLVSRPTESSIISFTRECRRWQIDLVDDRNDFEVVVDGQIGVGQVWASTPWEASTTSRAPSQEASERETS